MAAPRDGQDAAHRRTVCDGGVNMDANETNDSAATGHAPDDPERDYVERNSAAVRLALYRFLDQHLW
jgi:hypothetical protein